MKQHDSDCAVNNAPALPIGPCNCGFTRPIPRFMGLRPDHVDVYDQHVLASDYDDLAAENARLQALIDDERYDCPIHGLQDGADCARC